MLLQEIRGKIDKEEYTAFLPMRDTMTSYQVCKSSDPTMPGYWFTINRGFSCKPDKEHYRSWEDLMRRQPSWPVLEATLWDVM